MKIGFAVAESSLGWVLVAATGRGICTVMLGGGEKEQLCQLQREFPGAEIAKDEENLRTPVKAVLGCLAGTALPAALPLDLQGTAFQLRVWEELRRIPRGEKIAYGELARRIGKPQAARAVARACATNPLAILTPCHRVVRGNGELGGYRWGIERKRRLLEEEQG